MNIQPSNLKSLLNKSSKDYAKKLDEAGVANGSFKRIYCNMMLLRKLEKKYGLLPCDVVLTDKWWINIKIILVWLWVKTKNPEKWDFLLK